MSFEEPKHELLAKSNPIASEGFGVESLSGLKETMSKFFYWLLLFAGITTASCTLLERNKFERVFSFDRNLIATKEPELV